MIGLNKLNWIDNYWNSFVEQIPAPSQTAKHMCNEAQSMGSSDIHMTASYMHVVLLIIF